jgi:hypothetical protein
MESKFSSGKAKKNSIAMGKMWENIGNMWETCGKHKRKRRETMGNIWENVGNYGKVWIGKNGKMLEHMVKNGI